MKKRLHVLVTGRVQGVFYRDGTIERARELGLTGWVKNLPDGRVEIVAEGPRDLLEALLTWCREGPTFARVDAIDPSFHTYLAEFVGFDMAR